MGRFAVGGLLFMALGAFIYWRRQVWLAKVRSQIAAAQHWPEANARIDFANAEMKGQGLVLDIFQIFAGWLGPRPYTVLLTYRFDVGGQIYQGHRLAFGKLDTTFSGAQKLAARYPKGGVTRIRYNPQDPRDNVVEPRELFSAKHDRVIGPTIFIAALFVFIVGLATGR